MEFCWKPGSRFKVDANVAQKELLKVRKKNDGDIPAAALVEHAKPKSNPLHGEFEWNDSVAAAEYRCGQARKLLHSIVEVRNDVASGRPQRVYEVVTKPASEPGQRPQKVYRTIEDVMADPDTRAELLGRALRELVAFRNRYRDLQELAIVLRGIDSILETVEV